MLIPTFTPEFRLNELEKGRRSLFYFGVAILGFDAWDARRKKSTIAPVHRDLAHFLEGRHPHHPWNRAVVCAARGLGKSVWTTQAYPWWRGLYATEQDFSVKLIENSSRNAQVNHVAPMIDLFTSSRRADYLQWLYEHRIPVGFKGWTSEQVKLVQVDPLSAPFLTFWGLESRFEGWHGDVVLLDDPEGADAEKSLAANEESYQAYQKAIPLLKDHTQSQILIVLTPHGARPLAYRLRDQENWQQDSDNAHTNIKFFWREIVDENGESRWPERFPKRVIDMLRKEPMFEQQMMLRRRRANVTIFDMGAAVEHAYRWADGLSKTAIAYNAFEFDPDNLDDLGQVKIETKPATIETRKLRFFLHWDPLHRTTETRRSPMNKQRPAEAAIGAVGVAPDLHAFFFDYWTDKEADILKQVQQLFRMYLLYAPHTVTYEGVGAQIWALNFVRLQEQSNPQWSRPKSSPLFTGVSLALPRMSTRMKEAEKTNETKEYLFRESLSPWVNYGVLHLGSPNDAKFDKVRHQLENVLNEDEAVDLIDLLAQGPPVWSAPAQDMLGRAFAARRRFLDAFVRNGKGAAGKTGIGGRRWG